MSYISSIEFRAIALACDELHVDLQGLQIVDNGNGIMITTDSDTVKVIRYAGKCPFTYEAYVTRKLEESPAPMVNHGAHRYGTPVFDVMADAWLDGLLTGRPVRTPLERELGVIYG